jgi:glycosyltransferase involved in cell wall biosynthesis
MILPEDMTSYMELLYSNKEIYKNLSMKSANKFNSSNYSWATITKQWMDIFDKL